MHTLNTRTRSSVEDLRLDSPSRRPLVHNGIVWTGTGQNNRMLHGVERLEDAFHDSREQGEHEAFLARVDSSRSRSFERLAANTARHCAPAVYMPNLPRVERETRAFVDSLCNWRW